MTNGESTLHYYCLNEEEKERRMEIFRIVDEHEHMIKVSKKVPLISGKVLYRMSTLFRSFGPVKSYSPGRFGNSAAGIGRKGKDR
jgi:hypothetical protein